MIAKRFRCLVTFILFATFSCSVNAAPAVTKTSDSSAVLLKKVMPSVVNIRSQYRAVAYAAQVPKQGGGTNNQEILQTPLAVASGVIVDAKSGYILTNVHAVEDAQIVTVTLSDGRHYTAKIIGTDKPSDIAVLQIKAKNLTAMPLADSNLLNVGDKVMAIGNPFGLGQSVTSGIISGLGRATLGIDFLENFIQTDAPINPGNSGGALINADGELVGINSAIVAPGMGTGIAFAIPSNMAKSVMQQLIQYGNVKRGTLGVGAQNITPELANAFGLSIDNGSVITLIMPGSPAEKIGLKVGDIITNVNGADIKNANDVVNAIAFLRVDSKANIKIIREGKPLNFSTTITDPQVRIQKMQSQDPFLFGMALKDFTLLSPLHGDVKGILVVEVDEETNAGHSDIRPGDVIISANKKTVTSIDELKKVVAETKDSLLLNVLRGSGALFLVINKET